MIQLIKIYIQYPRNHFMLSKREREYLSGNLKLSKNYEYKITHSIRNKIKTFYQLELPLLQNSNCAEESRREASRPAWLGKLTSCQSGLTPPKETRLFLTKNHNGITKFGNGITENRNYIAEVHSDPDLANLLSIL